jgi:hypothetical protein
LTTLSGGVQNWVAQDTLGQKPYTARVIRVDGSEEPLPKVALPPFKQIVIVFSLYSIKSLYMLTSLLLLIVLRRERASPVTVLWWGLA